MELIIFGVVTIFFVIFAIIQLMNNIINNMRKQMLKDRYDILLMKDDIKKMQQERDQMRNDACRDRMHTQNIIDKTLNVVEKTVAKVNEIKADVGEWSEKREMESGTTIVESICDMQVQLNDLDGSIDEIKESLKITDHDVFEEIPKQYDDLRNEMFELRDQCKEQMDDVIRKQIKLMQLLMGNNMFENENPDHNPPPYDSD